MARPGADGVLGTVEACVSLWADAVASAVVTSPYPVSGAERACLVREYLLGGESLRRLDIRNGRPVLVAARCANVVGASPDPETWRYQLDVAVPAGSMHAEYEAARVLHWRRAPSPSMPWRGRQRPGRLSSAGNALAGRRTVPARGARYSCFESHGPENPVASEPIEKGRPPRLATYRAPALSRCTSLARLRLRPTSM